MRIERVALEHHGDVALGGRQVVDDLPADRDHPAGDVLEPGDHAQQGRFAAAGGADQHDEGAVLDFDVDAVDDLDVAVSLAHVANRDLGHFSSHSRRPERNE